MSEDRREAKARSPRPGRGVSHQLAHMAGGLLACLLTLVIVVGGALWLRLELGPIALNRFAPVIEAEAAKALGGVRLSVGGAEIGLGEAGGIEVRVNDVALFDDDEAPFARAPMAAAAFNVTDLLAGRFAPHDVILAGVSARLIREADGGFSFGFGGAEDDEGGVGEGADLFNQLLASSQEGAAGSGQRLVFRDARFLYKDRLSGRVWRTADVGLRFWNSSNGVAAQGEGKIQGGRFGSMALAINGYRKPEGEVVMSASLENAAPRDIADQIRALDWLAAFNAPVGGEMQLSIDPAGSLLTLEGRLDAGEGALTLGEGVTEPLQSASLAFSFEPAKERFRITSASLASDRASMEGAGFVEVGRDEAGEVVDIVAQLDLGDMAISAPEAMRERLEYDAARLTGRVTLDPLTIEIGELRLEEGPLFVTAAGRIEVDGEERRADVSLSGGGMTVQDLLAHWPIAAAPGAYEWMAANMTGADVTDFDATVRLGGEEDDVKFDFSFENGAGHYLRPMPPIVGAVGAGQVDLKRFSLSVEAGTVTPEGGAPLDIAGSSFVIADLDDAATPADIELLTSGDLSDVLAIVDHEPLGFISRLGLPLENPKGDVTVTTKVRLPLLKALLLEDVKAAAVATITDLSISSAELGGAVTSKEARLEADTAKFQLSGVATVKGLPLNINWREVFATGERDIKLRGTATPKRLASFGVEAPWFRSGSAALVADVAFADSGPRIDVSADLTKGDFRVGEIGWSKPEGEAATIKARVRIGDDAIRLRAVEVDSRDLKLTGNARIGDAGALERFELETLQYRGGADLRVAGRNQGERWNINVSGRLLDLTKFEDLLEGGDTGRDTPLRLRLELDRLQLRPELHLGRAKGEFTLADNGAVAGQVEGLVEGAAPFRLNVNSGPQGGDVTVRSANAGELMRAIGIFDDGSGGELRIRAKIADTEDIQLKGTVKVTDIIIHEDAKLEALLLGADLDDLRQTMRADGIVFDRISAPFTFADEVLRTKEAVAVGPFIGVNISGKYGLESETIDLDGVFTPAYALNSALGNIPVLGQLFTGGDGQGLFAFNFSVKGAADDPKISVNPLSVLTPGIFRKIFSLEGDSASSELRVDGDFSDSDK